MRLVDGKPSEVALEVFRRHDVVVALDGDLEEDLDLLESGTRSRRSLQTAQSLGRPSSLTCGYSAHHRAALLTMSDCTLNTGMKHSLQ